MTETSDSATEHTDLTLDDELPIGPGASFTFIYYFSTAAIISALIASKLFGVSLMTGLPSEVGMIGGAIAGGLGVLFNRSRVLEIPFTSKKKFRQQVSSALQAMGYFLEDTEGSVACYQRPNASRWFAGDIYVQERDRSVVFVSRAGNIRTLAKLLKQ